jgi:foldase protein PrsA
MLTLGEMDLGKENSQVLTKKYKIIVIAVVGVIVLFTALAVYINYTKSYVARIGYERITTAEFRFFLKQQKDDMLKKAGNPDPATFWSSKIGGEDAIEVAKNKALDSAKELKIQMIKAKEQKTTLDNTDIKNLDDGIKQIIVQNNNSKVEANKQFKATYGVDLDEFREIYKGFILANKIYQKEYEAITVTEDELPVYYEKFPEEYTDTQFRKNGEEAVWARHILIKTVDDNMQELPQEKQDEAKKKSDELLIRAKNGEDFVQLVKDYSEDAGSANTGGAYVFGKDRMMPEFEEAAFNLKPGEVSELVKTAYGYHIIKLEEKYKEGQPVSINCAKDYWEFGLNSVKILKIQEKLDEWKNEYQSSIKINKKVYDSIS